MKNIILVLGVLFIYTCFGCKSKESESSTAPAPEVVKEIQQLEKETIAIDSVTNKIDQTSKELETLLNDL